jgi:hypothetical protein
MEAIFYPVEKIEDLIKSISNYQKRILNSIPKDILPKILGKYPYKNLADLKYDELSKEFYTAIYNAGLRKEFGIKLQTNEITGELEGIFVTHASVSLLVTYIHDLLFFRQILDLDTKKKVVLQFGIIENEKDEKGVPLEDFMFIST